MSGKAGDKQHWTEQHWSSQEPGTFLSGEIVLDFIYFDSEQINK